MRIARALALLLLCLPAAPGAAQEAAQLRITGSVVNVRARPSPRGAVLGQLRAGDAVRLVATEGDWHEVELADGRRGFVYRTLGDVVAPPPPPPPPLAVPEPPPAAPVTVAHDEVGCVVRNEYPKLDTCLTPRDAVGRAEIHFRANPTDPWFAVELKADEPCHSAFLPKPGRGTTGFEYYVSGVDRGMGLFNRPAGAPAETYKVRVVRSEDDCGGLARVARSLKKLAAPILVAVARDPAGALVAAESALAASALLGFSPEGVVLAHAAAGAASSASAAGTSAAGTGGGAGGMSMTTIGIAAGGALAAVVAVAAASGGDDGGSSGTSGGSGGGGGGTGGGTTTPPAGVSLSGRWNGNQRWVGSGSGFGATFSFDCTTAITLDLTHAGANVTGTGTYGTTNCTVSLPFEYRSVTPPPGGTFPVGSGTASNGTLAFTVPQDPCPPLSLRGTYTASRFDLTGSVSCNTQGVALRFDGTITGTR